MNDHHTEEKRRFIEKCKICGLCVERCPIIQKTELRDIEPKEIQREIKGFLVENCGSRIVKTRVLSCMQCFGCVDGVCPEGLNPMGIIEIIKQDFRCRQIADFPEYDPKDPGLAHRVIASIQVTPQDYERILTPSKKDSAKHVFFAGCNIYFQPEKVLNALDIVQRIDPDVAFIPGLYFCCGDSHIFYGRLDHAEAVFDQLLNKVANYHPESLILWCPTCQCRFERTYAGIKKYPFAVQSVPQFISANLERLEIEKQPTRTVTVHEACKAALTGLDAIGPRKIIEALGYAIAEMPRHGEKAVCCGSGAFDWYPEACFQMADDRLLEASGTGADTMVTVCHYCNQLFASRQGRYNLEVESYINLLATSLGIEREDRFKKYKLWADTKRIMKDAQSFIAASPFSCDVIEKTVKSVFEKN